MLAITRTWPPQLSQLLRSSLNSRFSRCYPKCVDKRLLNSTVACARPLSREVFESA